MSGVLIHHGQTRRREERRSECQRQILCHNTWWMREHHFLGSAAGTDNTSARSWAGGNKTHTKALINPAFRQNWSVALRQTERQANCLQFGPLQSPACPCQSLWQIESPRWFRAVYDHDSEWVVLSAIHVLFSFIQLIFQAYLILHSLLTPLFSPSECVYFEGVLTRAKVLSLPQWPYRGRAVYASHGRGEKGKNLTRLSSEMAGLYSSVSLQFWTPSGSSGAAGSGWQFPSPCWEEECTSEMLLLAILTIPFMAILRNLWPTLKGQQQQTGRLLMQEGQSSTENKTHSSPGRYREKLWRALKRREQSSKLASHLLQEYEDKISGLCVY